MCGLCACFFLVTFEVFSALFMAHFGINFAYYTYDSAPNDTRDITFNQVFWDRIELLTIRYPTDNSPDLNASIYMLKSTPMLGRTEDVSFQTDLNYTLNLMYYFHAGSEFSVSACMLETGDSRDADFVVRKGADGSSTVLDFYIKHCDQDISHIHSYSIGTGQDDMYQFFLFNHEYSVIRVNFTFHRIQYDFKEEAIVDSCSVNTGKQESCSIEVPLTGETTPYLVVHPLLGNDTEMEWDYTKDSAKLRVRGQVGKRAWILYLVINVSILGLVTLVVVTPCVCVFKCTNRKKKFLYVHINDGDGDSDDTSSGGEPNTHSILQFSEERSPYLVDDSSTDSDSSLTKNYSAENKI